MKADTERIYSERILKVLVHIQEHLDEPLELSELGRVAYFSPFHFHRIFRGLVGESVMEHIRRLRLERAVYRIKSTDRSILEIALDAGYETHESFTRAFRGMFGMPPSDLRRGSRKTPPALAPSGVHYQPEGRMPDFKPLIKGGVPMEVRIEKIEPIRVAFMRHIGPYEECGKTWAKFCAWAGPRGLFGPNTTVLGISHDDPEVTPPEKIRYDACITVDENFEPEGEVGVQEISGGDYAVIVHHGPYERLIDTYSRICGEWAPRSGRVLKSGPCFEIYRNNPEETPPEVLVTDVYVPLEPR